MSVKEKLIIFVFASVFLIPVLVSADTTEYSIKASFLEKFIQLTQWPEESEISDLSKSFIISVIGKNPFGRVLDNRYQGHKIKNRTIEIRYISSPKKIQGSHLLFISASKRNELSDILSVSKGKPILTVSEVKGFAEKGVHINFYKTGQGTLHFEINESMVNNSGLRMNLMLLEVAKIINPSW